MDFKPDSAFWALNVLVLASLGVWAVAFPAATALLAALFKRVERV